MIVDVIILSHAKTAPLFDLTQATIDSCHASDKGVQFNILVLEQEPNVRYRDCVTGFTTGAFNYNKYMNLGISLTGNEYVCLCNNDLVFGKDWATNLIAGMEYHELLSACPANLNAPMKGIHFGYQNNMHMLGWCIMTNRKLYDIIGEIDDEFPFWFADNIYSEQLKKFGVKHAVMNYATVKHLGSSTLKTIDKTLHTEYTTGLIKKFIEKHPENESAKYFKAFLRPHQ
jgi:GT2 family glycosyltransferase